MPCATSGKPEPDPGPGTFWLGWPVPAHGMLSWACQTETPRLLLRTSFRAVFAKKRSKRKPGGAGLSVIGYASHGHVQAHAARYARAPSKDGPAGIPTESRLCDRGCACALCPGLGGAAHTYYALCAPAPLHAMYAHMNNEFENVQVPCGPNPSPVFCSLFWN